MNMETPITPETNEKLPDEHFIAMTVELAVAFEQRLLERSATDPQNISAVEVARELSWTGMDKREWLNRFKDMEAEDIFALVEPTLREETRKAGLRANLSTFRSIKREF